MRKPGGMVRRYKGRRGVVMDTFLKEEVPPITFVTGSHVAQLFAAEFVALVTCTCRSCKEEDSLQVPILSAFK